ncbi:CocE/NonD family hydrolase, partial [Candidatus Poribacteria bacterium]|nr:CocE/NonD family hydrolase [Candidatus Poribacteria bacterium]
MRTLKDVMAPMRDGVRLATDVCLPDGDGPFPVVLTRNPYGKEGDDPDAPDPYTPRGYVYVMQDCRGTGKSEGDWEPFVNDRADGLDTHAWVLAQHWCDGSICTTGGSYLGWTQWSVAADTGASHKAMFTTVPLTDWHRDCAYIGGGFGLGLMMGWGVMMARPSASQQDIAEWETWKWPEAYRHLPLATLDTQTRGTIPYLREWVGRPAYDDYWAQGDTAHRLPSIDVPTVTVAGWYDVFANHAFSTIAGLRALGGADHHLIVGPWVHDTSLPAGERDFGPNCGFDALAGVELSWFDHHVRGAARPPLAPYRIFVMGRNEWRDEEAWPLPDTRSTPCYLREGGALSTDAPGRETPDDYVYDPDDPVPTHGGCILFDTP